VYSQVTSACTGVRTLKGELSLSGRVGNERLPRTTVHAGFERPSSMRLEGLAPFGGPIFILAARGGSATLVLPRDERIIRNAPPEAILEALAGIALGPPTCSRCLRVVFCRLRVRQRDVSMPVVSPPSTSKAAIRERLRGRQGVSAPQWLAMAAPRRQPRPVADRVHAVDGAFPQSVRLLSTAPDVRVALTAALSQIEANEDLDPAAFAVEQQKNLMPMTVDELRQEGRCAANDDDPYPLDRACRCRGSTDDLTCARSARAGSACLRLRSGQCLSARSRRLHAGASVSRRCVLREHRPEWAIVAPQGPARDGQGAAADSDRLPLFRGGSDGLGSRLVQLTWNTHVGFVYDLMSFKQLQTFSYTGEGWGLARDARRLIMSDGTSMLRFLDPQTLKVTGQVQVMDGDVPVRDVNELEFIDGQVYANVWLTDRIAIIAPDSGRVTGWINLAGLMAKNGLSVTPC
jgi:hypothetical protein